LAASSLIVGACTSGGSPAKENEVAATVNGRNIMLSEVERALNRQTGGKPQALNQLQLASARLQILDSLIQREVLFQRAERDKVLPTDAQIEGVIATQKQNSGMSNEDFEKSLQAENMTMEGLRNEARKDLAISALQDKYSSQIKISDRDIEDYYATNRDQFKNERGVELAMIMVDPADNSAQGLKDDAKNETDAKLKIDNVYQQLKGGASFADVARAKSEDINTIGRGGDVGFATEEDLRNNSFPQDLINNFFGPMQVGDYTQPHVSAVGSGTSSNSLRSVSKRKT
jgi:peptidyl-prolyl cis-trans isomerase SurA